MGQRSQIFIRYNKKLIVANYYQWNYGERMISRARSIIEYLKANLEYPWYFESADLSRYCDVNFDYRDISRSSNIFKEWEDFKTMYGITDFNKFIFTEQDNNDGKLLIDVDTQSKTIKYCLLDCDNKFVMSAEDYLKWDTYYSGHYEDVNWELHYNQKCIEYTKENIQSINKNAQLMSKQEVDEYLKQPYNV